MRQLGREKKQGRRARRSLLYAVIGISLSGCGGGGGSSQTLKSGVVPQQTASTAAAVAATTSAGVSRGCSVNSFVPNFATDTDPATNLPNQLYHWTDFPARVYFVPGSFLTPARKAQTLAGFDWWAQATDSTIRYQEVGTATSANVLVQYEARGETKYGAITEYHTDGKRQLADATITFNMTYLANDANITPVAAHEFGHALGIGGHSTDAMDVMSSSAQVYSRTALSVRDVNTLKTAYCGLPDAPASPGVTTSAIAKGTGQTLVTQCNLGVK